MKFTFSSPTCGSTFTLWIFTDSHRSSSPPLHQKINDFTSTMEQFFLIAKELYPYGTRYGINILPNTNSETKAKSSYKTQNSSKFLFFQATTKDERIKKQIKLSNRSFITIREFDK